MWLGLPCAPSCLGKPSSPPRAMQKLEESWACDDKALKISSHNPGGASSSLFLNLGDQGPSSAEVKMAVNPLSVGDAKLGQRWLHSWLMENGVSDPGGWLRDPPGSGCGSCLFTVLMLRLALIAEWLQYQPASLCPQDAILWVAGVPKMKANRQIWK